MKKRLFAHLLAILVISSSSTAQVFAVEFDEQFYSGNDILFYDPRATACGEGSGSLAGSDNAEKVWNYLTSLGLKPVAVAGIMGNFHEETGGTFDPAIKQNHVLTAIPDSGDGRTGYGIAQWTNKARQAGLFAKIRAAGLEKYYGAGWGHPEKDKTEMPPEDINELLEVELNYAWSADSPKIQGSLENKLNAATSVKGDDGSTVIFHKIYEGSADNASQIAERVTAAENYLNKFGDESTFGGGCAGQLGGVATMEDAIPWGMKFIEDTAAAYNPGGHSLNNKRVGDSIEMYVTNDGAVDGPYPGCWGGTYCGQCTALSGWFSVKMTEYGYVSGNGRDIVRNLKAKGAPTGTQPRPFSVFSTGGGSSGHTGIVLGVLDGGEVITLENNIGRHTLIIFKYNITERYPDVTFAYVGDKMSVDVSSH